MRDSAVDTVKTNSISTAIVVGGMPVDAARLIMMPPLQG
jgi:hypothetical protein